MALNKYQLQLSKNIDKKCLNVEIFRKRSKSKLTEKQILDKFESDFNSGKNIQEGLNKAFNNLPDGFLKKECIFKRIKRCTEVIEEKITFDKINKNVFSSSYGFELLSYVFDKVDEFFKEYDSKDQDTLIMRVYDNIERGQLGNIVHF
jgi:hypothetical protein